MEKKPQIDNLPTKETEEHSTTIQSGKNDKTTSQQSFAWSHSSEDRNTIGRPLWLVRAGKTHRHSLLSKRSIGKIEPEVFAKNSLGKSKSRSPLHCYAPKALNPYMTVPQKP